ncbi:MAG: hypothetical protein QM762_17870 [Chryseolinea sp.]
MNQIPKWILHELSFDGLIRTDSSAILDLEELMSIKDGIVGDDLQLFFCDTTASRIRIARNVKSNEHVIIWDENYLKFLRRCISVVFDTGPEEHKKESSLGFCFARTAAERLLVPKPEMAMAAMEMVKLFYYKFGISKEIQIRGENNVKFLGYNKIIRWWILFHEIGHYLYSNGHTDLYNSIGKKIDSSLELFKQRDDWPVSEKTSRLRELGVIKFYSERRDDICGEIVNLPTREEVWCDFFAIEQVLLKVFNEAINPSFIYPSIMLAYYASSTLKHTEIFFNQKIRSERYIDELERSMRQMTTRTDLRMMHLLREGLQIYGQVGLNREDILKWVDYTELLRFAEAEGKISGLLNSIEYREECFSSIDRLIELKSNIEMKALYGELRQELGWA